MKMQATALLLSLFIGVLFGVLYDVIRFVRVVFSVRVSNPFVPLRAERVKGKHRRAEKSTGKNAGKYAGKSTAGRAAEAKIPPGAAPCKKERRRGALFQFLFVVLTDFLFFAVCAVLMCVFFFLTGDGRVRGFPLLGAFLGFLLYYNTVGRLFIGICEWLSNLVKRVIRAFFRWIWRVLRFLLTPFRRFFSWLGQFFRKITQPIVSRAKMRYNEYKLERLRRARRARMKHCGSVCRNQIDERDR